MYSKADLKLLSDNLEGYTKSPYFDGTIKEHAKALIKVIKHILHDFSSYDGSKIAEIVQIVWVYHEYFNGSSLNQKPNEIEFCMRKALNDWLPNSEYSFATALVDKFDIGKNFHFSYFKNDPWDTILFTLDLDRNIKPTKKLILMGLPRMYNLTPLFCTPLYHELGHFVDNAMMISKTALHQIPNFESLPPLVQDCLQNYFSEFFADLFAACYIGETMAELLISLGNFDGSETHPSTNDRVRVIRNFVKNVPFEVAGFPILESFQNILSKKDLKLEQRFEVPELNRSYDDIRPYQIESDEELHGLFIASWDYLMKIESGTGPEWSLTSNSVNQSGIINNLVAKSIQNYLYRESWKGDTI